MLPQFLPEIAQDKIDRARAAAEADRSREQDRDSIVRRCARLVRCRVGRRRPVSRPFEVGTTSGKPAYRAG